jgi:aminoglycoside phosphotransferase (APT) family kinase protein
VVFGSRGGSPETILDLALAQAKGSVAPGARHEAIAVRSSGVLVSGLGSAILRLAIGPGARLLAAQRTALEALAGAKPDAAVAARIPSGMASGQAGLATWSLERRLPGQPPQVPLSAALVDDCVSFLVALHRAGWGMDAWMSLSRSGDIAADGCSGERARAIDTVARRLERELAHLPRGYAHGDFWAGNLLVEDGRLSGVFDWMAAGAGRLPLLDLFELRVNAIRDRSRLSLGRAVLRYGATGAQRDDAVRTYCQRLGVQVDQRRLRQLLTAYWLEAMARSVAVNAADPHESRGPAWQRENIDVVLEAIADDGSLTVG